MIPTSESTGINNFGQLRHHRCTLSARGARLHNASSNRTNFSLPKSVCSVPASTVVEYTRSIADYIYQSSK